METTNSGYQGLNCFLCKYWFCKMYLFKQHNRKYHRNFGDFLDLPPLPENHRHPYNKMLFARFHVDPELPLLMRIFVAETQCTMRVANSYDFEELLHKQQEGKCAPKPIIVYDVSPLFNEDGIAGYTIAPWAKPPPKPQKPWFVHCLENAENEQDDNVEHDPYMPSCSAMKYQHTNIFLQSIPNPFCGMLETFVDRM